MGEGEPGRRRRAQWRGATTSAFKKNIAQYDAYATGFSRG